jgi:hypothetical protein
VRARSAKCPFGCCRKCASNSSRRRVQELVAGIGAVGEETAWPGKEVVHRGDDERSTIAVLYVGMLPDRLCPQSQGTRF